MDPRHPELAASRMRELMKQFDRIESDMKAATTSPRLAQLEREGALVVQEICLTAPRLHEAMMQTARFCRRDLHREYVAEEHLPGGYVKATISAEPVTVKGTAPQFEPEVEEKPKKKKTTKKKKTEE